MPMLRPLAMLLTFAALLGGCGQAEAPKAPPPPPERGIFISASDCAENGILSAELCGQAVDKAVSIHEQAAPSYKSLRQCTAAEGPDRCSKAVDGSYRARLQAFFITMSNPPDAIPLYPSTANAVGFRSAGRQAVDATDENIHVSIAALTVANENAKLPNTE